MFVVIEGCVEGKDPLRILEKKRPQENPNRVMYEK